MIKRVDLKMYCTLCEYFYMGEEYICCSYSNTKIAFNIDELYRYCEKEEEFMEYE